MAFKRLLALAVGQVPYLDGAIPRCRGQLSWVLGVEGDCYHPFAAISEVPVTHKTVSYDHWPVRVDRVYRRSGYITTEKARESYECPANVSRHAPVSADHTFTVSS
jgi:hypothetical protein